MDRIQSVVNSGSTQVNEVEEALWRSGLAKGRIGIYEDPAATRQVGGWEMQ